MLKSFFAALVFTSAVSAPGTHAFAPCASGQSEISVEGVNGVFCVQGSTICAADISQGACPRVQEGLPYGSYCGKVASGVFGCKVLDSESVKTFQPWVEPGSVASTTPAPTTAAPTPAPTTAAPMPAPTTAVVTPAPAPTGSQCAQGSPVSVEGVNGVFCVTGSPICAADVANGACPGAQTGLPYGSYCGRVASGVFGCKVLDADSIKTYQPGVASGAGSTTTVPPTAPATAAPPTAPTTTSPVVTPAATTTPVVTTTTSPPPSSPSSAPISVSTDCPTGGSPMSVEGVKKIFCVSGIACAADIAGGNCPGKQEGLPFGSFCDIVRTGVYGCRAYTADNTKPGAGVTPPLNCTGNAAGSTSVSIVGAKRDFCAQEPICSGNRYGNCPSVQPGLDQSSTCVIIATGVFGCVFK